LNARENRAATVQERISVKLRNAICWIIAIVAIAGCNGQRRAAEFDRLQKQRQELVNRLKTAEEEQRFLAFIKDIYATDKRYLVLDTHSAKGVLRVGKRVLREFPLLLDGCRKPEIVPAENEDAYVLPKGRVQLIAKREDPVWYKPDWLYEQEMAQAPPLDAQERLIAGPMGKYALFFGGGFVIHGRPADAAPPMVTDHACIILENDDLRAVYNLLDAGSFAYIR
jgi:hypothetical protein